VTPKELRQSRIDLGLNGTQCAKFMGVTLESYSRWEHGRTRIPVSAQKLMDYRLRFGDIDQDRKFTLTSDGSSEQLALEELIDELTDSKPGAVFTVEAI